MAYRRPWSRLRRRTPRGRSRRIERRDSFRPSGALAYNRVAAQDKPRDGRTDVLTVSQPANQASKRPYAIHDACGDVYPIGLEKTPAAATNEDTQTHTHRYSQKKKDNSSGCKTLACSIIIIVVVDVVVVVARRSSNGNRNTLITKIMA